MAGTCSGTGAGSDWPLPFSYQDLFEESLEPWLLTTSEGTVVRANRACTELFGYTEAELCVLSRDALLDPTDPRVPAAIESRRRTGRFRGEVSLRRKDGTCFPAEASSAVFVDAEGFSFTSTWLRDLTEQKRIQNERDALLAA
ncbi:MAG TPA: PAS domain S-box protein, partial [Myxococcota bacterium]|nr:PAS domain S-box protein [Myxococcota bacterium]